jgi:hypothetical protein
MATSTASWSDSLVTELDPLLAQAREADPADRILLRDQIASHGETAIDAMTDWLGDERLAAFAIRVLERIGQGVQTRDAVTELLAAVDREELPPHLVGDLDRALSALGRPKVATRVTSRGPEGARPIGLPGVVGRGYWVMRTSPWERPYIWAEAQRGRLRQGWGWDETQNLEVIAEAVRDGFPLNELQQLAWRARKMRTTAPDGMRLGDVIVAPNLPEWGRLSVFRITGSYRWEPREIGVLDRFGHVLPVELVAADIDRRDRIISDGLRAMLRPQTRLYGITGYGGDVEGLMAAAGPARSTSGRS